MNLISNCKIDQEKRERERTRKVTDSGRNIEANWQKHKTIAEGCVGALCTILANLRAYQKFYNSKSPCMLLGIRVICE